MPVINNIFSKRNYVKDGEQMSKWYKIGILKVTGSGRKYLRLFHQPEITYYVLDKQEKPEENTE